MTADTSTSSETSKQQARAHASIKAQLKSATGINPAQCYQCGKCTAGCLMAAEMPLKIHQILRAIQLDQIDKLLTDESIWLCLGCETCSTRCPNEVEPARIIDALREIAAQENPKELPRYINAFHQAFLKQIMRHGRIFEFGLIAAYKLKTGRLFDDVSQVPAMLTRGKLALSPRSIDGIKDIRRIFKACEDASVASDNKSDKGSGAP
ncbi:MAG: 4Fe-4S dicluster domain-containing protein [Deltaproteobacteria bacterium]|nr:4Fe-4S dicluster domain-containing protein [Deltaproteobacteria bacterium]